MLLCFSCLFLTAERRLDLVVTRAEHHLSHAVLRAQTRRAVLLLSHRCCPHQEGRPGLLQLKATGLLVACWEEHRSRRESPFQEQRADTRFTAAAMRKSLIVRKVAGEHAQTRTTVSSCCPSSPKPEGSCSSLLTWIDVQLPAAAGSRTLLLVQHGHHLMG